MLQLGKKDCYARDCHAKSLNKRKSKESLEKSKCI